MPSHTHTFSGSSSIAFNDATWISSVSTDTRDNMDGGAGTACVDDIDVSSEAVSATGSASGTTGSAGSGTAMDFAVRYADIIIATKD
jgi:microcystin-dependent protein